MNFSEYYNFHKHMNNLISEFTVKDFKLKTSRRSKSFLKDRQQNGNVGSELVEINWVGNKILLKFNVVPTFESKVNVVGKNSSKVKKAKHYAVDIQFVDTNSLIGTRKEFLEKSSKKQIKLINELIKNGEVKIHSNDMSWYFQGTWENAAKFSYNINPFPSDGVPGDDIWIGRHDNKVPYVTKHILEVLASISSLSSDIIKKIKSKYS